jgi:hypothetical protein
LLTPSLLRTSLKLGIAAALAGALAVGIHAVEFIWYPLLAVSMCMDDSETHVLAASRTRMYGTVTGGVVGGLVHTILEGWFGLTVSLVLLVPLLRRMGWQSSRAVGVLVCSELFLVGNYSRLDWQFVAGRTLDTLLGVAAVLVVSGLIWPVNRMAEIRALDGRLRRLMTTRLTGIRQRLKQPDGSSEAIPSAAAGIQLLQSLGQGVADALRSAPAGLVRRQHWRQRQLLWERIHHHSLQVERLARLLPPGALAGADTPWLEELPTMLAASAHAQVPALPPRQGLLRLAQGRGLPPLLLLALDDELQRLVHSLHSLALAGRRDALP